MFGRKPTPLKDREVTLLPPPLEERIVTCQDCKHLLYKKDTQEVQVVTIAIHWVAVGRWSEEHIRLLYYCPAHQKAYDYVDYNPATRQANYYRTIPASPARHELVSAGAPPKEKCEAKPIPLA